MKYFVLLAVAAVCFGACKNQETPWQSLFNGNNLDGWETYVGPVEEGATPLGLNNDTLNLFSVVDMDGQKVMRISGEVNASIATKEAFENYHLVMEMKWGDEVFTKRNSGLLYHSYGDFGVGLGVCVACLPGAAPGVALRDVSGEALA